MKKLKIISSIQMFLGVTFGAFGAHALKNKLSPDDLEIWKTATFYLMIHALAALVVLNFSKSSLWQKPCMFFLVGNVLFSGSLYLLCLTQMRQLGAITPLGGISYLIGWGFSTYLFTKDMGK
jgi:uncharacterized membrane protein YgdD (TMEM256/DUF423 family)